MNNIPSEPAEWKDGQIVTETKKRIALALVQGFFSLAEKAGRPIKDTAHEELLSIVERHT